MTSRLRLALLTVVIAGVIGAPGALIALRGQSGSAAFGDVEEIGRNRVSTATLDIASGSRTAPIRVADLAPGDHAAGAVELVNVGSLPLRYSLGVSASAPGAGPWLTWFFLIVDRAGACPTATTWRTRPPGASTALGGAAVAAGADLADGSVGAAAAGAERRLDVGGSEFVCIGVALDVGAPNSVQATTVDLTLTAHAQQIVAGSGS